MIDVLRLIGDKPTPEYWRGAIAALEVIGWRHEAAQLRLLTSNFADLELRVLQNTNPADSKLSTGRAQRPTPWAPPGWHDCDKS